MGLLDWFRAPVNESTARPEVTAPATVQRAGFEYGIPAAGLTEYNQNTGQTTGTDRRSNLQQLYETYLSCTWAWASVNAIARTITAGGLVTDWDGDDGEGDKEQPDKPAPVLALERLLSYCNPREDVRQLLRSTVADLEVFGDAYIEVVWWNNVPVALYTLDCPSMMPLADDHGSVTGYVQVTDTGQRAEFESRDVIHISLDSPRSGLFGVSPTQAASLPITAWLFTNATLKETMRKGSPPSIHADLPPALSGGEVNKWVDQYMTRNIGPRNIGRPVATKGGGNIKVLQPNKIQEYLHTLDQKRDEIISTYGVPPAEVGVIESGNLGGGTGESQRKTFLINTCQPIAELVLEKLNFHLAKQGFGVVGWHLKFAEVDMRDSETIERIRDTRLRNGSWSLDRYRAEIGEPPADGGSEPVLVDRQNLVLWRDMDAKSKAGIAKDLKGSALMPSDPGGEDTPVELERTPAPDPAERGVRGLGGLGTADTGSGVPDVGAVDGGGETARYHGRVLRETWVSYRKRRAAVLAAELDTDDDGDGDAAGVG